jgi:hypothetical protein
MLAGYGTFPENGAVGTDKQYHDAVHIRYNTLPGPSRPEMRGTVLVHETGH